MPLQYTIIQNEDGSANVVLFGRGSGPLVAHSSHHAYGQIMAGLMPKGIGGPDDPSDESLDYEALFAPAKAIEERFARLSDRVTVRNGVVLVDGDPVEGSLEEQILAFLDAAEDFGPLVSFYEKLLANPLGSATKDAMAEWMAHQGKNGGVTITPEGDVLGYKALGSVKDGDKLVGYKPSRVSVTGQDEVNDVPVGAGNEIIQNVGDTVSMPRSIVLHEPSRACAEGLHVGTWDYASTFLMGYTNDTVVLVKFSPLDVVSVPSGEAKIRVSKYTLVKVVDGPLDTPVFGAAVEAPTEEPEVTEETLSELDGARAVDYDGLAGTLSIHEDYDDLLVFVYDDEQYGTLVVSEDEIAEGTPDANDDEDGEAEIFVVSDSTENTAQARSDRKHGKGGRHSKAAEGNGLNPAQDPKTGQFTQGRPGSTRDSATGRFSA